MTDFAPTKPITYDEFMAMDRVEILDGEIVEMNASGALYVVIGMNISDGLNPYIKRTELGIVFSDGMTFKMYSDLPYLKDSFVPDVSFIFRHNIPTDWDFNEAHPGVPDFAAEVVSPNDKADDLKYKLDTYLDKGTQEVWRIFPKLGKLEQHWREDRQDRSLTYTKGKIDTSRLLPDWSITHEEVFYLPTWIRKQLGMDS